MIATSPTRTQYWALRGTWEDGDAFAWATIPVLHQDGFIDPRLASDPSTFTLGLPSAVGAPPERIQVQVEVDNADGALDQRIVGSDKTATEYLDANFLTLRGQIFRGTIAADGTCTEVAYTPDLAVSGAVHVDRAKGTVSFTLAHVDSDVLGAPAFLPTVEDVLNAELFVGTGDSVISAFDDELLAALGLSDVEDLWQAVRGGDTPESPREKVPFIYGSATVPLIRITKSGVYPAVFLGGVAWADTGEVDPRPTVVAEIDHTFDAAPQNLTAPLPLRALVNVTLPDGTVEALYVNAAIQCEKPPEGAFTADDFYFASDAPNGFVEITTSPVGPVDVLRKIIEDHSKLGTAAIDIPSWDAAAAAQRQSLGGCCAGYLKDSATIADLCQVIAPIGAIGLYFKSNGKLAVTVGGWSRADAEEAAGALPSLREPDIFPADEDGTIDWQEEAPTDPEDRGAVITRVSVEWEQDQRDVYHGLTQDDRASAPVRVDLAVDVEARFSGAWLDPRRASVALGRMASRGAYPTRRVTFPTHPEIAEEGIGSMLRITTPQGVSAEGVYEDRLVRLERIEVQPAEHAAIVACEDLGPAEHIRAGLLDDIDQWVRGTRPATGAVLKIADNGDGTATLTSADGYLADAQPHDTIWTFGATEETNRRSWEVLSTDGTDAICDGSDAVAEELAATDPTGPALEAAWIVMQTDESAGDTFREDYIRAADLADGELRFGAPAFQFTGR